jgi:hypothetical protein
MHFLGNKIATQVHTSFYIYSFESPMQTQLSVQGAINYFPIKNFYLGAGLLGYTNVQNIKNTADQITGSSSGVTVMPSIGFIGLNKVLNIEAGHMLASDKTGNLTSLSVRYCFGKKN